MAGKKKRIIKTDEPYLVSGGMAMKRQKRRTDKQLQRIIGIVCLSFLLGTAGGALLANLLPQGQQGQLSAFLQQALADGDEIGFAAYDLQLFMDTHRDCEEALELYKSLAFTYRAAVKVYEAKYGPLSAMNSSDKTPFEWVSDNLKWPW